MNKTVNINLGGIVFHIDEDAFEILNNYLNSLKNHFKNEEGGDEILKDIEGRIAEIFTEKLGKKDAVSIADVNTVVDIMGNPNQYDDEINEEEYQEEKSKEEDLRAGKRRRVFRDADDRMVAGVCGGLANYFDIDPLWIRLTFLILLFTGGGFLIYIIFWIAIPEAKTTAEKLEMKGEKVNISNIEKNIKDELGNIKDRMDDFVNSPKTKKYGKQARTITQNITDFFISLFSGTAKFIGSCLGMFAVGIGIFFLVIVSTILLSEGGLHFNFYHSPYLNLSSIDSTLSYGLLLFFGIPIIAVILTGLRLLFGTKIHSNYKVGMLILWIISWVLLGSAGINTTKEFRKKATSITTETITIENDTIFLSLNEVDHDLNNIFDTKSFDVSPFEDSLIGLGMGLDIIRSRNNAINFTEKTKAYSKDRKSAKRFADAINFDFTIDKNDLILDNYFTLKEQKWRMQELDLVLEIPEGKTIYLDHSLKNIIYDVKNVQDMWDYDMLGHYWKMEKEGLTCVSCNDE